MGDFHFQSEREIDRVASDVSHNIPGVPANCLPTGTELAAAFAPKETAHSLRRTSPMGQQFVGTCTLCGQEGLTARQANDACPNPRGVTRDQMILDAVDGDEDLPGPATREELLERGRYTPGDVEIRRPGFTGDTCPECGSTEVTSTFGLIRGGHGTHVQCTECGHVLSFTPAS